MPNFHEKVLHMTAKIPKGKVTTYRHIAHALGSKAYRAVGTALRNNEKPVVIPCHRVIRSDGTLGSYCGSSKHTSRKADLLKKEGVVVTSDYRVQHLPKYLYTF